MIFIIRKRKPLLHRNPNSQAQLAVNHLPSIPQVKARSGIDQKQKQDVLRQGMTLLEIIIVIAILAAVVTVVMPNLTTTKETDSYVKVNRLLEDIRAGVDSAVLKGLTHRLVLEFSSGDYWLERAPEGRKVYQGDEKLEHDLTEEEEQRNLELFREEFNSTYQEYFDETIYTDPESGKEMKIQTPLMSAMPLLEPPEWVKIEGMEWRGRSIGPDLMIEKMQAEHHEKMVEFSEIGPKGRGIIYIYPNGIIEKAVIYINYIDDNGNPSQENKPFVVETNPSEGSAKITSAIEEIDVHAEEE